MPLEILSYACFFIYLSAVFDFLTACLSNVTASASYISSFRLFIEVWSLSCLSVCLSVCLSPSFSLFDWMHMRQKLHTNNLIFWLTGWQGVRAERRERWKMQSRSHIKPVGSQPCLEKKKIQETDGGMEGHKWVQSVVKVIFLLSNLSLSLTLEL